MSYDKKNLKIVGIFLIIFILISSILFIIIKPKMHKQFQMNIVEYIMKINKDGSTTTTKKVTTTVIKDN